jgi:cbb3-type cytochrome c oxidase subunit III
MRTPIVLTIVSLVLMAAPSPAQKAREGGAIFQELCVGCHGTDGRGETEIGKKVKAADLTSSETQQQSDAELTKVVKTGQKKMPAFGDKLGDDEIKAVMAYVRKLGNNK